VVLELGGILKAKDAIQSPAFSSFKPPPIHKLFSRLEFIRGGSDVYAQQLEESDIAESGQQHFDEDEAPNTYTRKEQQGGWLDSDDIEDFD
jgi:cell cycle checkpoint protein